MKIKTLSLFGLLIIFAASISLAQTKEEINFAKAGQEVLVAEEAKLQMTLGKIRRLVIKTGVEKKASVKTIKNLVKLVNQFRRDKADNSQLKPYELTTKTQLNPKLEKAILDYQGLYDCCDKNDQIRKYIAETTGQNIRIKGYTTTFGFLLLSILIVVIILIFVFVIYVIGLICHDCF